MLIEISVVLKLWVGGRQLSKQGHNRTIMVTHRLKSFFSRSLDSVTIWAQAALDYQYILGLFDHAAADALSICV